MSLIEQIQTHQLYTSIDSYLEALNVIEADEEFLTGLNEYGIQTLNRCKAVFNHLKYRIESIDPFLQRKPTLDAIYSECSNIHSLLQSYSSYMTQEAHLNTINNRLENILANMIGIPQLVDSDAVEGIRDTVISFRRTIGQHRNRMETLQGMFNEKTEELTNEVEELTDSFNSINRHYETKYNEFETKVTSLQDSMTEDDEQRSQRFEQQIKSFEETFDKKLAELNEQWEQLLKENEQVIQETIEKLEQEQLVFLDETKQKKELYDGILEDHKKSVESLVGIISTNSISGHFKEVADKKEKQTSTWQKTTIGGFLLTIGFGVYAFIFSEDLDWPSLVARFIVTTALGSFTAYAARQAAKNELQEKSNRQMEVELKTLNPYIASFSDEDQIKLKEQLFPLIFGRAEVVEQNPERTGNAPINQLQLNPQDVNNITNALELLKTLAGTNKGA